MINGDARQGYSVARPKLPSFTIFTQTLYNLNMSFQTGARWLSHEQSRPEKQSYPIIVPGHAVWAVLQAISASGATEAKGALITDFCVPRLNVNRRPDKSLHEKGGIIGLLEAWVVELLGFWSWVWPMNQYLQRRGD